MSTSGWITKEDAAPTSGAGTNDLASRLGGFGLQDKTSSGGSQAATSTTNTTAAPSNGESSTPAATGKSQTVPDGWGSTSTPAAATSSSTTTEGASGTATPANGGEATQDDLAAAEKEAQEMSHEDVQAQLRLFEQDVQVTLADRQADEASPLYSAKNFEDLNLHPDLLKGIYAMGFNKPSKIQERALPLLLANPPRNMIGQSQSGTGKTAAFVLTMLSRIDYSIQAPQAICIAPTRELAAQIMLVVEKMGQFTPVTKFFASKGAQFRGEKIDAQLLVGTVGTFLDMIRRKGTLDLKNLKVLVLDEADNMLSQAALGDQSLMVKNFCSNLGNKTYQVVLFSATFPDHVRKFAEKFAPDANEIRLKQEELSLAAIKQFFLDCDSDYARYDVLVELYSLLTIGQSIIFVGRRDTADEISRRMTAEGHKIVSLHGQQTVEERDDVMTRFRKGEFKVLIATNVIARGIDVMSVNMVVNYDMPWDPVEKKPDVETYLHRIGRTGRFGRQGISINMIYDKKSYDIMKYIEDTLQTPIVGIKTDDFEAMEKTLKNAMKK
ncbi:DEAD-domain-containing protein [Cystobasidium minutum MCA 4210]|uniref:DEAD-domain-containing protein n=1 Tax=Cystobasidium minutum MCA 4210 TaxID=1397322 RepID=UPI0034CFDECA|eukprot:jgi/Rhomi1/148992/estExt_Genewise1.C_1_t20269